MKNRLLSLVLSATAVVACSSSAGGGKASNDGVPNVDDPGVENPTDEPEPDPGSSSGGEPSPSAKLALASASVRNIGRRGDTLYVSVSGSDPAKATSAAHLRFTDQNDAPVKVVDTNWDGIPDSAEGTFHFDTSTLGSESFEGIVSLPGAFGPTSKVANVHVALENESGARSAEMTATFTLQALRVENDPCDAQLIESRCEAGLACGGTPATCQPGSAPTLSKVGYFGGSSPKMVFRGVEADEDIASIAIEFLDHSNNPKAVVISGEGQDATTAFGIDVDARGGAFGSTFFVEATPASSFVSQVPKIAATAKDVVGRTSTRVITPVSTLPTRSMGQSCDPDGFDACATGSVCAPGIRTEANTCKSATTMRTTKCKAAPALDPSKGATRAYGTVVGASLWDAPTGCVPNDATGRPEAAIALRLTADAPSLTITTALPETNFDTAVYLIPSCAASSATALGCNDDMQGFASSLTLQNVPAGDYTIIVESVQMRGGRCGGAVSLD